jgi:hypothetical protein
MVSVQRIIGAIETGVNAYEMIAGGIRVTAMIGEDAIMRQMGARMTQRVDTETSQGVAGGIR